MRFMSRAILSRLVIAGILMGVSPLAFALPFIIVPKAGTILPTQIISGQTVSAYYTISNNTGSARPGNYMVYMPPNVTQVTSDAAIPDLCKSTFTLQPKNAAGGSCTLELLISGAVSANDPNPKHHLFACFPGGITCAGTTAPLNVSVIPGNNEFVAGGAYYDTNSNQVIAIASSTTTGSSWRQQALSASAGYQQGQLFGISCVGSTCVGVGLYEDMSYTNYPAIVVSTNKGATWSQQVLQPPSPSYVNGALDGVYCFSQNCIAVGSYNNIAMSTEQPLVATSHNAGMSWSQQLLPLPAGIQVGNIFSLNCISGICVGAGGSQDFNNNTIPTIYKSPDNGNSWSQQLLTLPNGYDEGLLYGVGCYSSTCIAVGTYAKSGGQNSLAVVISNNLGNTWTQKILTPPATFTQGEFNGISCSDNYCVAVGAYSYNINYSGYPAIAVTNNSGVTWTQQMLPLPTGMQYGYLTGVKCSGSVCVASGYYLPLSSNEIPFIALSTNRGMTWTQQTLPVPSPYVAGVLNGIG